MKKATMLLVMIIGVYLLGGCSSTAPQTPDVIEEQETEQTMPYVDENGNLHVDVSDFVFPEEPIK